MSSIGYISKIELENFMCHRKFEIVLSPNMNLIVGRNGSGKSSILTALIIGLGGGARTTGRGDNYKALIRHNCTDAYIKLTIRNFNGGPHLAQFGETFTIQRRIGMKTSSYSIKDVNGKTISTKAQDVRNICTHFGYHPDNVLVMLNQESAKEFLVTATPQVKYTRLSKALQVDEFYRTMADIDRGLDHRYEIKEKLKSQQATLEAKEKSDAIVLENAKEMHRAAAKITSLKAVLEWRKVRKCEYSLKASHEKVRQAQQEFEELQEDTTSAGQARELRDRILQLEQEAEPLQGRKTAEEQKLREFESKVNDAKRKVAKAEETDANCRQEYQKAVRKRDELLKDKTPAANPGAPSMSELSNKQKDYREKIGECSKASEKLEAEIARQDDARSEKMRQNRSTRAEIDSIRTSISSEERELRQQTSGQSNPLSGFGSDGATKIRSLGDLIDKNRWKSQKPVGPLARFVRSTDKKWSRLVANLIKPVAWIYWVQSREDQQLLSKLARQLNMDKTIKILTWNAERFSYNKVNAQLGYTRFMDCIKFDNEYVERIFIDQLNLENDVFCGDVDTAYRVSSQERQVRYVYAPSKHGDGWRRFSVAPNGNRENRPIYSGKNLVHLQPATDSPEAARQAIQDRIEEYKEKLSKLEAVEKRDAADARKLNDEISVLNTKKGELDNQRVKYESKLRQVNREIEDTEKAYAEATEEDLDSLSRSIDGTIRAREIEQQATQRMMQQAQKELILKRSSFDDQQRATTAAAEVLEQNKKEIYKARLDLSQVERSQHAQISRKNILERHAQAEKNIRAQLEVEVEDLTKAATRVGPRPVLEEYDNKDDAQIRSDITRFEALRDQLQQSNIDFEKRQSELEQLRQELSLLKNHYKRHSDELEGIVKNRDKRKRNAKKQHQMIMENISDAYKSFIAERNFTGQLTIDPEGRKLIAEANPQSTTGESRSTNTLSGGEKSFTQICLLLSIWSNITTGLVAMDEYDVFMDEVFRAASMEALVQTITGKGAQGILITPQGLPRAIVEKYKDTDVFSVHNLESPR